jgi:DNA-directed RNA polymerase subunit RPC12/RpoP
MSDDMMRCPKCRATFRLPQQLAFVREITREGGDFMGFVQSDSLPCPGCGFRIPISEIVNEPRPKRNKGSGSIVGWLLLLVIVIAVAVTVGK